MWWPSPVTVKGPDGAETKVEMDKEYPDDEFRDEYASKVRDRIAHWWRCGPVVT